MPWGGRPGAPPQLITLTGILDEATAATTAISRDSSLGVAPAGALRQAALSVIGISITTCKKLADFVCGFGGLDTDAAISPAVLPAVSLAISPAISLAISIAISHSQPA